MFPAPSAGGAPFSPTSRKIIRLILKGCTNRPFFHISLQEKFKEPAEPVIEQLGTFDPMPNRYNEKLVAINYKRVEHWLREGVDVTVPVLKLLGLAGYFPVHPESLEDAWNNRKKIRARLEELRTQVASFSKTEISEASASESDLSASGSESSVSESELSPPSPSASESQSSASDSATASSEDPSKPPNNQDPTS